MTGPSHQAHALCRLGDLLFAVPSESVVQAIPRPSHIMVLPRRGGPPTQVFVLRGQVVPLQTLGQLLPDLGPSPRAEPPDKVMVFRLDGRWLALEIDALVGMERGRDQQVVNIHPSDGADELFHAVLLTRADQTPVSVLDVPALFSLSGFWGPTQRAGTPTLADPAHAPDGVEPTQGARLVAVVRALGETLVVAVEALASVDPMPVLQRQGMGRGAVLGIAHWRGQDLRVIHLGEVLGQRGPQEPARLLAVLRSGEHLLGVAVDEAQQIQALATHGLQSSAEAGLPAHPALQGLLFDAQGQRLLVLDVPGLLADAAHSQVSGRNGPAGASPAGVGPGTGTPHPDPTGKALGAMAQAEAPVPAHVVFQAGGKWALPIQTLDAITPVPAALDPALGQHPALCGHTHWRGGAVPVWDLRRLVNQQATTPDGEARIVLTQAHGRRVGLLCERLWMLLPARQGQVSQLRRNGQLHMQLITVMRDQQAQSFRILRPEDWLPQPVEALPAPAQNS